MKTKTFVLMTLLVMSSLLFGACAPNASESTPTLSVEAIQTNAVAVFANNLTLTALAAPTNTPLPSSTPTFMPLPTLANTTPLATAAASTPVTSCNSMSYVADVTIPDNTPMTPGQTFTKTWKVLNNGSCAWEAGFKFAFTSGDAMGGATYTLPQAVPVNSQIEISIAMTAPNKSGSIRGNWRMSTAAEQFFGNEIYVMILVGSGTAATNSGTTATSTSTPEPTVTPTP